MFIVIVEDEEKTELSSGKQVRATKRCQESEYLQTNNSECVLVITCSKKRLNTAAVSW